MAELSEKTETHQREGFAATMSRGMLRHALVALAATCATAATGYLTRKGRELWEEKAMPAIRERGGAEAVAKEAFAKASELLGATTTKISESEPVSTLVEKVEGAVRPDIETEPETETQPLREATDPDREAERRERRRRRAERQRALKSSGST